jgi:hypothetical protein
MPRDLTDLMESATRTAPPEPHAAADITRLAARRHRRRTTSLAAAACVAVIAAGAAGYGLTRGDSDTAPEPAAPYKLDQTVDVSQVVSPSTLPGYTLQPWTIPSVQRLPDGSAIATYQAVDASGRLLVVDAPDGTQQQGPFRARLYDTPGGAPLPLQAPASPGNAGSVPITWLPAFYGDDQLLWHASTGPSPSPNGFHITDLQGGHDEFVPDTFQISNGEIQANPEDVTDGSVWMSLFVRSVTKGAFNVSDVYRGTFSGDVTKVGTGVIALDVGPGMAGWVTTRDQVFVQAATGTAPERVRVPLDKGCRLPAAGVLQSVGAFAVSSSAVAIDERCGSGHRATDRLLAFDLSGRRLARITGVLAFNVSFAGHALLFQGNGMILRYDLATGTLAQLGTPTGRGPQALPQGAGSYVLWYDDRGHVAKIGS